VKRVVRRVGIGLAAVLAPLTLGALAVVVLYMPQPSRTCEAVRHWSGAAAGSATLYHPMGLASGGDALYVADAERGAVEQYGLDGTLQATWTDLGRPVAVAWAEGLVYAVDFLGDRVVVLAPTSRVVRAWGRHGAGAGEFDAPSGIAVDRAGTVYVTDLFNHRVQAFTGDGHFLREWGGKGRMSGEFHFPTGVAVSGKYLYVSDFFPALYALDISNPTKPTLAGTYSTSLGSPHGVYLSGRYAYIADQSTGLVIADVSNPAAMTKVGSYHGSEIFFGVSVAGNYAYNLALLGHPSAVLATAGRDAAEYREWLEGFGIDCRGLRLLEDEHTATGFTTTDLDDNQITGYYGGAMLRAGTLGLDDTVPEPEALIVGPNAPEAMGRLVREAGERGLRWVYDPAHQLPHLNREALEEGARGAWILIGNDYELELIRQRTGRDLEELLELAQIVVTPLGRHGSTITTRDGSFEIPADPARREVDPVGAGDAYRAGLVSGLLDGRPVEQAGRIAALAAAYVVEQTGTVEHAYTREEFSERHRQAFGEELAWKTP